MMYYIVQILVLILLSKVQNARFQVIQLEEENDENFEETERIVNGRTAGKNEFPFSVALFYRDRYVCTASIISERDVLTAGHCVVFNGIVQNPEDFSGVIGNVNKESGTRIKFTNVTPHPQYDNLMNDVAVLTAAEPIRYSDGVRAVCLSTTKKNLCLKPVTSAGWGITTRDTDVTVTPDNLQYTNLRVYPNKKCAKLYNTRKVPDSIMCAGALNTGLCSGDSGGPLVMKKGRNDYVQVGVASFVNQIFGCARLLGPAGFSRVSHYIDFIMSNAKGKVCLE
nr:chymotrypsin-1 isoform X2 [Parasteatoda tepidariorum]